jgi:hypothetical protein
MTTWTARLAHKSVKAERSNHKKGDAPVPARIYGDYQGYQEYQARHKANPKRGSKAKGPFDFGAFEGFWSQASHAFQIVDRSQTTTYVHKLLAQF